VVEPFVVVLFVLLIYVPVLYVVDQPLKGKVHLIVAVEKNSDFQLKVVDHFQKIDDQPIPLLLLLQLHIFLCQCSEVVHQDCPYGDLLCFFLG